MNLLRIEHPDQAVEALTTWLDELHGEAEEIVEAHWAAVRAVEQKMPGWENKSALQVRYRRIGNSFKVLLKTPKRDWPLEQVR